jgi:DNA-binding LacI/PurR family transcriptional regulator
MTPHVDLPTCSNAAIPPPARTARTARRVTSIDVARHAGVSQSTVSLVLSGKGEGRISAATAATVRDAARALGYRPNAAARALRSGTATAVGLVVRDVTHPFFARTLLGAQRAARATGHVVVLIDSADWTEGSVEALPTGSIDGFLFFAATPPSSLKPGRAGDATPPVVLIESERAGFTHVRLDVEAAADAVLAHLHELGHRRIGYLASAIGGQTFSRRHDRWSAHLRANGVDPEAMPMETAEFEVESTVAAGHRLLDAHERPTAVICDDDLLASGLLTACRERGVRVPADLSVAGFDDLDLARLAAPALTTVHFDAEALGAAAFEVLLARLEGRRPRSRVLPVELVVRDSTAAPPRRP